MDNSEKVLEQNEITNKVENSPTVFRKLFESGKSNDFETLSDMLAENCEWVLMPNMKKYQGKAEIIELCKGGKFSSDRIPEILSDTATSEGGVFEYNNTGTITRELSAFAKFSDWAFPADSSTRVGEQYSVPVCFVYHLNSEGKIYLLHEYLDLASLMRQFKPGTVSEATDLDDNE